MAASRVEVFEVHREDLARGEVVTSPSAPLGNGEIRAVVEFFALTANNVTYAAMGSAMRYFDFFPAQDPGRGVVPVWGFARVEESRVEGVEPGRRLYGYLPTASHVTLSVTRLDATGFVDGFAHRRPMASAYNRYRFVDASGDEWSEAAEMLLRPLHTTGFLLADAVSDPDADSPMPPRRVIVSSASSKTAWATAHAARETGLICVGVTSRARVDVVEASGLWDEVRAYGMLGDRDRGDLASVYVDLAGSPSVTAEIHRWAATTLQRSLIVGATHHDQLASPISDLEGPSREFFFAPDRILRRHQDWGASEYARRLEESWGAFASWAADWIEVQTHHGAPAVAEIWSHLVAGDVDPRVGHLGSFAVVPSS